MPNFAKRLISGSSGVLALAILAITSTSVGAAHDADGAANTNYMAVKQ